MAAPAARILVIEDNALLRAQLQRLFADGGMAVEFASDGLAGLQMALDAPPDVLVLDVGLPGLDGLRLCQRLRTLADRHVPVLMLTARDALEDKLQGFRAGADDYLVKPFAAAELLARCQALTVRHRSGQTHVLRIGSLRIDRRQGQAARHDLPLALHQTAYQILLALAEAWPRTLTRSELIQRLWGDAPPDSDPLRTHLYLLRQALDKPFATPMLKTVHGVGFRLQADA
ncbi:response regulator transcription factor [Pseudoxanthomonas sp. F37]|jgi:DNA-binding response OmpR family regulator|uniref:response regulator transcription factor n=1 Tax=Pseudoxanthomonas TaxID=83618 RepID=UPI001FD41C80|nr:MULTISPECIES: response regulator transcription factor [Pseudoxanthomonas]UOV04403.1 response regulator transcription factor [Pseudoxanthomonas mexicana]UOV09404.1 response regulator transcription factor [Pseudoxanthomonas sp. F37]